MLCGDMGVGKTCIVRSFVEGKFSSTNTPKPTLSGIFSTKTELVSGANVTFEIWDTAGQERYRTMQPMYYRKAKAALIVYDTTDRKTFDGKNGAMSWVSELRAQADPSTVIGLVGNKTDLEDAREVTFEEGAAFARDNGLVFVETSAATNTNISKAFVDVAAQVPEVQEAGDGSGAAAAGSRVSARRASARRASSKADGSTGAATKAGAGGAGPGDEQFNLAEALKESERSQRTGRPCAC